MRTISGLIAAAAIVCSAVAQAAANDTFPLRSDTFSNGATIPVANTYDEMGCTGNNVSPDLHWSGAPSATKSFALTVFDPDARKGSGWWHWVVYGISPSRTSIGAGEKNIGTEGVTSFGTAGYGGPCPPPGDTPHHYIFTLYALDDSVTGSLDGPHLLDAIKGHVLAKAVLVGRFGR